MRTRLQDTLTLLVFITLALLLPLCLVMVARTSFGLEELTGPELDAGFTTTWPDTVDGMLRLADVHSDDLVYDLGCGDGRIVIAAARQYGARGIGIDLNPRRIEEAKAHAKAAKVEQQVQFRLDNFYTTDFSDATVVTLYLPQTVNEKLRPILWRQLAIGTRIVSNKSDMGPEWPADKIEKVGTRTLYLWIITEKEKRKIASLSPKSDNLSVVKHTKPE